MVGRLERSQHESEGIDSKCYQTEFIGVNEGWQIANQEQLADNALLGACLSDRGLAVPKTRQEKVDALPNAEVDLGSCLSGQQPQRKGAH